MATVEHARVSVAIVGGARGTKSTALVKRNADQRKLVGWTCDAPARVQLEVEGERSSIAELLADILDCLPIGAELSDITPMEPIGGETEFMVLASVPERSPGGQRRTPAVAR